MLARVANNLFWMGRYIERSEHMARYLNVNYFSSLDAPNQLSQSRQFVLRSMLFMVGEPVLDEAVVLDEEEVLYKIGLDYDSTYSIINNVKYARENANSARDLISTGLYEAINKFYHFILRYPVDAFVKRGLYDFTGNITEMTTVLRGKIRGTLLHDQVYAIIMMGMNMERATQIIRIINSKYNDALRAQGSYGEKFSNSFEWTTLLKCAEAYDMMRRFYKKTPNSITTLEFLILNPNCPRSIMNSLNQVYDHIRVLDPSKRYNK
ncbi:MAG: alpha-E domain-containing protein, partial [Bacteroidota bacterium]